MSAIDNHAKLAIARFVKLQWEPIQRSFVLLYPEGLVRLNATASEILKRCDGDTELGQIIADLERAYLAEGLAPSVTQFVAMAVERRWLEVRP